MDEKKRRGNLILALTFAFFMACFSLAVAETVEAVPPQTCKACGGGSGNQTCYDVSIGYATCISSADGYCNDSGTCP